MTHTPSTPPRSRLPARPWMALAGGLLSASLAVANPAQTLPQAAQDRALAVWGEQAREWIGQQMAQSDNGALPLRPEVEIGMLDPRLRLAPCARVEPYLPAGTRLWGRSRIGLRCQEGPVRWNVFLPVTVRAWGPAWVLKRPVPAGTPLTQEDADLAEIDWADQASPVLATPERWVGQQAAFALQPGVTLRQNMVRPVPAFAPGAQVRVSSRSGGLQVVVLGEALTAGIPGQVARVRLGGGKVVSGTVRPDAVVDVRL